ncbi:MAG: hypothetical protein M1812_003212 [Candelaria pacifica]|nr:MAG: hypothetical protein M1812_003212 [Candelaria pacifica]
MSKDAAIFTKGKIRGENRFPPFEITDEGLLEQHRRFRIFPSEDIQAYPRHIPYNSDKKSFLEKTGRESFEAFQYTFKLPGEDKEYIVMWDYNIGLVRITPFFKCRNYSKTTPAKMLNANPGLRDICHSITGGALAAQGYWMPYASALAIAATFCHSIRHALTPLFGPSFPSLCIPPDDPRFGRMIIDRSIVRSCTEEALHFKSLEENEPSKTHASPNDPKDFLTTNNDADTRWKTRLLRPKVKASDIESGYGTDTDQDRNDEKNFQSLSPSSKYDTPIMTTSQWTCTNTPSSSSSPSSLFSPPPLRTSKRTKKIFHEPKTYLSSVPRSSKRNFQDYESPSCSSSSADERDLSPSSPDLDIEEQNPEEKNERDDDDEEIEKVDEEDRSTDDELFRLGLSREARAAYLLMQLHIADKGLKCEGKAHRDKRRRRASN